MVTKPDSLSSTPVREQNRIRDKKANQNLYLINLFTVTNRNPRESDTCTHVVNIINVVTS